MSQKERETKTETKSIVLVGVGGQGNIAGQRDPGPGGHA